MSNHFPFGGIHAGGLRFSGEQPAQTEEQANEAIDRQLRADGILPSIADQQAMLKQREAQHQMSAATSDATLEKMLRNGAAAEDVLREMASNGFPKSVTEIHVPREILVRICRQVIGTAIETTVIERVCAGLLAKHFGEAFQVASELGDELRVIGITTDNCAAIMMQVLRWQQDIGARAADAVVTGTQKERYDAAARRGT